MQSGPAGLSCRIMLSLIRFFWEMFLLRRKPQDLPASVALLVLLALLNIATGLGNNLSLFGSFSAALGANLVDLLLTGGVLFVLLRTRNHAERWLQTTTAFFGIGTLSSGLMLAYRAPVELLGLEPMGVLLSFALVVWAHVVLGHILRHALQIPWGAGIVLVFAYTMLAFSFINQWFPVVTQQ